MILLAISALLSHRMTACPILEPPCPEILLFLHDFPGENTAIIMQLHQAVLYMKEY
ncbi:hypothetical protein B14911_08802 [Bacillus sp. NRRL B-14911]|nr:hypothetical protein B14911_08802 [Bacillus sp. NRRL B-14911]